MDNQEPTQAEIDDVAKALRQVICVKPQLLFKAAHQVIIDLSLEILAGKHRNDSRGITRQAMYSLCCVQICRILLANGLVHFTDDMPVLSPFSEMLGRK